MSEVLPSQKLLTEAQLSEFYADNFVATQIRQFLEFTRGRLPAAKAVVDVGGGCGHFAHAVQATTGATTRVIDMDAQALERCGRLYGDVEAVHGDGIAPPRRGDEGVVCFNLMLHHLVGESDRATTDLQMRALTSWRGQAEYLFVNEYIYESPANISGRLIYEITSSRILSAIAKAVSKFVPSLRANTFGVGVRFRSNAEWVRLFKECGFEVVENRRSHYDKVAAPQRLLLIRSISIDSFLLKPVARG